LRHDGKLPLPKPPAHKDSSANSNPIDQAPTAPPDKKPSARTLRHQRITGQIHPLLPSKIHRPDTLSSDSFLSSKRDKRLIKHSSFLSRVQSSSRIAKKSTATASSSSKHAVPGASGIRSSKNTATKQRRPKNKIASLDSLADALPDLLEDDETGGIENLRKIKHRSLKSKKGALKRKEMVVRGEMERFGASMARMTETSAAESSGGPLVSAQETNVDAAKPATSDRWAALRGYISSTMEQNPAFTNKS
jgi:hypothetical protein